MLTLALFLPLSALSSITENQPNYNALDEKINLSFSNNIQVIDNALWKRISMGHHNEMIEIIVQFDSEDNGELEEEILLRAGFVSHYKTRIVPSIFAKGLASSVSSLANIEGIKWVEWNAPMKYHMDQTIHTIKAIDAWDRQIIDQYGYLTGTQIKGNGVTVVVVDSGIDASHPDLDYNPQSPNNPIKPQPNDKVIYNAKLNQGSGSNTPEFLWIPASDTDTSSGHGTHCAGTVAGNGDASAGNRLGIAPNSWLIGLSMGELAFTIDEYSALEHVYDLSKPGSSTQQAWNIRVVTNSWGPGFPFDSIDANDLTVQIIEKLSVENNVAVIFANGNDGGDGNEDQSNIFAKVPVSIGVAASNRDGVGMSDFSSRGDMTNRDTWPDVAAPGVDIWSAAARATMIGGGTGAGDLGSGELDYYYLAISGTSMATPHVAGLAALLWQAAPSMKMSNYDEDLDSSGNPTLHDPSGIAPPQEAEREIHEVEAILKLTADYITSGENLADNNSLGFNNHTLDYAQGYGLVNADNAVALALTLQRLRDTNGDGVVDNENIEVLDAFEIFKNTMVVNQDTFSTSGLTTNWDGDFAVFTSDSDLPPASSHRKEFYVPQGTTMVFADLEYNGISPSIFCPTSSLLRLALDTDGDGNYEDPDIDEEEITIEGGTQEGAWWGVDVQGTSIGSCLTGGNLGPRASYTVEVTIRFLPTEINLDLNQSRGWDSLGDGVADITMQRIQYTHPGFQEEEEKLSGLDGMIKWLQNNWWLPLLITLTLILIAILSNEKTQEIIKDIVKQNKEENMIDATILENEDEFQNNVLNAEILEAELL
jgi:subtilisin family serine protease